MSAWTWLLLAGIMEILWAVGLKVSGGLQRPLMLALTVIGMIVSFVFLSRAMKTLPLGTSYAVWTGIGAAGTAIVGMLFLGEAKDAPRLLSLTLVIVGIVGLRLTAGDARQP